MKIYFSGAYSYSLIHTKEIDIDCSSDSKIYMLEEKIKTVFPILKNRTLNFMTISGKSTDKTKSLSDYDITEYHPVNIFIT